MKLAEAAPVACDTELVIRRKSDGSWGIKPAPASKIITDITPQREEPLVEEAEPSQLGKLVQDECIEEQSELGEEPVPVEPLEEYVPFVETKVTAPQLILFGLGVICALAAAVACILPYGLIPDSGVTTWIPAVALTAGATGSFVTLAWGKSKTAFIVNSILVASLGGTLAASVDYSLWPWLLASATLAFAAVMSFPEHIGAQTEEPSAKVEELAPSDEFAVPAYSN
jgi:hypothetical protein